MLINKSLAKNVSRREFLQKSAQATLALGGGLAFSALTGGCATVTLKEEAPVIYPPLTGHKVQPPQEGCLFGFYKSRRDLGCFHRYARDAYVIHVINHYEQQLGKRPSVIVLLEGITTLAFPIEEAIGAAKKGVIPLLYTDIRPMELKEIVMGEHNQRIQRFAEEAAQFGQVFGGFFFTPMFEVNINRRNSTWSWSGRPSSFKKAWRHMWQIFEDSGANQYATWVLEYHVDHDLWGYWPGDEYVDWIGLSAYNRRVLQVYYGYRDLSQLISGPYNHFRKKYPNKPIMIEEFGTTLSEDQPHWLRKAFQTIKSKPGLKAAAYFDNLYNLAFIDDHALSEESIEILQEVFKDPYFMRAE